MVCAECMGCGLKNTLDCYGVPVPHDNGGEKNSIFAINIHSMNWLLMATIWTAIGVEMGGEICYSFLRFVTHFLVRGFGGWTGDGLVAGQKFNFGLILG